MNNRIYRTQEAKPQVVLMTMQDSDNESGVSRFIEQHLQALEAYSSEINVCSIRFVLNPIRLFPRLTQYSYYNDWEIPLPIRMEEAINHAYWMHAYNEFIFKYLKDILVPGCILHLNTLNLIDLAVYIQKNIPCRILSHLHCIPWKSYYNSNRKVFNDLYDRIYNQKGERSELSRRLQKRPYEMNFYHQADRIICVTQCAADFLHRYMNVPENKIEVIYNGIADKCGKEIYRQKEPPVLRCLYAGFLLESKGVHFILDALRIVKKRGYKVELLVAGHCSERQKNVLLNTWRDIPCQVLGLIPFNELTNLYETCDLGIIGSLQEQCSYVALEMMMFGLPVVTTLVDGLGELFVDGQTALGVGTRFSPILGLSVNTEQMASQIIRMIEEPKLRLQLSHAGRLRFKENFTQPIMAEQIMKVYRQLFNTL